MKKPTLRNILCAASAMLGLAAIYFSIQWSNATTMQVSPPSIEKISIKLGEDGADFAARYPQYLKVNRQPAGLNFYEIDMDGRKKIMTVRFEHGKHSFEVEHVLSVMGTQDMDLKEGQQSFNTNGGVTAADEIMHDDARQQVMALLKKIKQAGWQVVINRGTARLRGKQAFEAHLKYHDPLWLDGDYEPTLEEWMQLWDNNGWKFYADNAFLNVTFMRDQEKLDPTKPGAYLLSLEIESAEAYYRGQVEEKDRKNWRLFWPVEEAKLKRLRKEAEDKARATGLFIDTDYQDPPLPPEH